MPFLTAANSAACGSIFHCSTALHFNSKSHLVKLSKWSWSNDDCRVKPTSSKKTSQFQRNIWARLSGMA